MNRKLKRLPTLSLTDILVSGLSGCGSNSSANTANNSGDGKITLKFWNIWRSDADSNKKNF